MKSAAIRAWETRDNGVEHTSLFSLRKAVVELVTQTAGMKTMREAPRKKRSSQSNRSSNRGRLRPLEPISIVVSMGVPHRRPHIEHVRPLNGIELARAQKLVGSRHASMA